MKVILSTTFISWIKNYSGGKLQHFEVAKITRSSKHFIKNASNIFGFTLIFGSTFLQ